MLGPIHEDLSIDIEGPFADEGENGVEVDVFFDRGGGTDNFDDGARLIEAFKGPVFQRGVGIIPII